MTHTRTTGKTVNWRGLELVVDGVLIPREETQLLVLEAMVCDKGSWVHEVGTGCGAVALAIKLERPDMIVTASDIDPHAVEVALWNADCHSLKVKVVEGVGLDPIHKNFNISKKLPDLIVANLPYLSDEALAKRPPEVAEEPTIATQGECGPDGLGEIRKLIEEAPPGIKMILEHDTHHGHAVRGMLDDAETRYDYSGSERVTIGWSK